MTIAVLMLLVLSSWYVPGRLGRWLKLAKWIWPSRLAVLGLLAGYIALIMSGFYTSPNPLAGLLYNCLGLFLIFHAYLFFLTAISDLARLAARRESLGPKAAWALAAAAFALVFAAALKARSLAVTETVIAVKGLPKPVSILHAPDLHLGAQRGGAWLEKAISEINALNPDLVIYNGDLADSNIALTEEIFGLFKAVKAPQFMTTGNHEYYIDTGRVLELSERFGVRPLRNEAVETHGFQLAGLEYMSADREARDPHMVNSLTIEEELPKIPLDKSRPIVVIHHSPVGLPYVEKAGADVMLSGHTHGGQVFPGTILIQARFKYWKGLYQAGETTLLVSQGAGTFGPWARLGSFNEIQLVRLIPG